MSGHARWEPGHFNGAPPERLRCRAEIESADALAQAVHDRRTELGMSRAEFAEHAGVDEREIARLEDGPSLPDAAIRGRLRDALPPDAPAHRAAGPSTPSGHA
ncbi:helix-turn-helix domain-containing protein [Embleya sp. NPDC059237]|uniref:helix-turn-helix domain-containing protein n=1 Tax=Embleya sp. NPDC059237 TaxID=3346784 RepID=UPI003692FFDD